MELIKIKNQLKKRRPRFIRSGAQHIKRISRTGYRRAKGLHNKVKDNKKGRRAQIQTGYGFPKQLRGTNKAGLTIVAVSSQVELDAIDPKVQAVVIKASLGLKKKIPLYKSCVERKITVVGLSDVAGKVSTVETLRTEKTKVAKSKQSTRKQNQESLRKASEGKADKKAAKAADKKAASAAASASSAANSQGDASDESTESVKDAEKKAKDKVLTSKQ
jgi:large subunit ribosomal protein L32e